MSKDLRLAAGFAGLAFLAACIGMEPSAVTRMESRGDSFQQALHGEYAELAMKESALYDWPDAARFAHKATAAAEARPVGPDEPAKRRVAWPEKEDLVAARARLVDLLRTTEAARRAPATAAAAQAAYDCWLEEQEEGHQPAMIATCRERWEQAMADLETELQPPVAPAAPPILERAIDEPGEETFRLYFALDSALVDARDRPVIDRLVGRAMLAEPRRIIVEGHADRSGPEPYNAALSERRARAVAALLADAGVPPELIDTAAFGEALPEVPTPDGIAHPRNRRVVVSFL